MILLLDNYDSFIYNLYQYLGELGAEILVRRNDEISIDEINEINPNAIVISPGPGRPENAGRCIEIILHFYQRIPIIGICLGHQAIGAAFGAKIVPAKTIKHGKTSSIKHLGTGIFQNLSAPLEVMRYHSLVVDRDILPEVFEVLAISMDDQEIMAMKHQKYPLYGVQFHPESIGTISGKTILKNFLLKIGREKERNENFFTEVSS
jgi:anthranilate synthase component II